MKVECLHNHHQTTADAVQRNEDMKVVEVRGEGEGGQDHMQSNLLRKYQLFSTWLPLFTT